MTPAGQHSKHTVSLWLPLFSAAGSFWVASLWSHLLFVDGSYYLHPAMAFVFMAILGFAGMRMEKRGYSGLGLSLAFAVLCAGMFGLADGLLDSQNAMSRWLSWGLFQYGDAPDYIFTANQYLVSGMFETSRGRVISNLTYAGLLNLTHFDVHASTRILSFIAALASVLVVLVALRLWGSLGAAVVAYVLIDFANEHIGGTTTEMPGFLLGTLAFAMLLQAAAARSATVFLVGFGVLCMAMLTRVGAVFVIPALMVWLGYAFWSNLTKRWLMPVVAVGIFISLSMANGVLTRSVAPTSGGSFANAADIWYATLVEGQLLLGERSEEDVIPVTRWVQIYLDHPELRQLSGRERTTRKMLFFVDAAIQSPVALVVGGLQEVVVYFTEFRMYSFITNKAVRVIFTLLTCLGLFISLRNFKRGVASPVETFLAIGGVAIIASMPFLYGGESRVPAPTVGFLAALAAVGVRHLQYRKAGGLAAIEAENVVSRSPQFTSGITRSGVLLTVLFGGIFMYGYYSGGSWAGQEPTCKEGQIGPIYMNTSAALLVGPQSDNTVEQLRKKRDTIINFRKNNYVIRKMSLRVYPDQFDLLIEKVALLKGPKLIGYGFDLSTGRIYPYTIAEPTSEEKIIGCAREEKNGVMLDENAGAIIYHGSGQIV